MDVISILRKQRQRVTGYDIEVVAERRTEHPRAVTRVEMVGDGVLAQRVHGRSG